MKIITLLLIFLGEMAMVYAEIRAARLFTASQQSFVHVFFKLFIVMAVGGGLVVAGYMAGLKVFKNIWIVSVTSITSILLIEPVMNYFVVGQLPTRGALIGLILGVCGLLSAIFF